MNAASDLPGSRLSEAEAHLAKLNSQVSAMRAVLVQLLQEVVVAEASLDRSGAHLLLEANEQLIVSALGAQMAADTAHGALDEANRLGGLDPLTRLPNRTILLDRFELAISNAKRHGNRVALLFLDLDAFKQINDTLGHAAGDQALRLVADCLSSLVRETDTVSRHGGDEFLVILAEVTSAADAQVVADKVNVALASLSEFDSQQLRLRASIGISIYPEDGEDARSLIACADAAMYEVKKQGQTKTAPDPKPTDTPVTPGASRQRPRSLREYADVEQEQRQQDLRDANESLILAALGAQDLLAAAEEARRRQAELLALVAKELSDPHRIGYCRGRGHVAPARSGGHRGAGRTIGGDGEGRAPTVRLRPSTRLPFDSHAALNFDRLHPTIATEPLSMRLRQTTTCRIFAVTVAKAA